MKRFVFFYIFDIDDILVIIVNGILLIFFMLKLLYNNKC